jgi:hypothetical protein
VGWLPDGNVTLGPGEGAMFRNPTTSPLTFMFSGDVLRRDWTNTVPAGTCICSSVGARAGMITTDLGFPAAPGDVIATWSEGRYTQYIFDDLDLKWTPSEPTINPGQAFFSTKNAPAKWVTKAPFVWPDR